MDRGVDRALDSETAAKATERFLDNETTKRVWGKVLESDEAQKLVERVADAPEVRAAIAKQGIGMLEDLRRGVRSAARQVDTAIERVARRVLRRPQRERRPIYAGSFSRLLALAIDAGVVYGSLLLVTAAIAALINLFSSGDQQAGTAVIALGFTAWSLIAIAYLVIFWSGAGRTPGMSFVAIRMLSEDGRPVRPGQAFRRVIWLGISALPLLLGYWGVLFERERRGWPDRRAHTVVCYADPELDKDLGLDRLVEQLVRLAPLAGRDPERDVAAAVLVERVIRGDHGLDAGVRELLAPGSRRLQLPEVADHVPVVVARVADVQLGEAVGMERVVADAEQLAELVAAYPWRSLGGGLDAGELRRDLAEPAAGLGILGLRMRRRLAGAVEVMAVHPLELGRGDQPHGRGDPVLERRHRVDTRLADHLGRHVGPGVQAVRGDAACPRAPRRGRR